MLNQKMFVLIVLIFLVAVFFGYLMGKNSVTGIRQSSIISKGNSGDKLMVSNQNKFINKDSSGSENPTDTSVFRDIKTLLGLSGSGIEDSINLNSLDFNSKTKLKALINSIPVDMKVTNIDLLPKISFYTSDGKFYFFDSKTEFQSSKIDKDDDYVRWFQACGLPRLKGEKIPNNPYIQEKVTLVDDFYASNWEALKSSPNSLAKILLAFNDNGFCDITQKSCKYFSNTKELRSMILNTMEKNRAIYDLPGDDGSVQNQIDLYLTCILPKYTQSPTVMLSYLNQVGHFPSLLGVSDDVIMSGFYSALDKVLVK